MGTHSLVRTCADGVAADGNTTVAAELKRSDLRGLHLIEVRNKRGDLEKASLELRFQRILVHPPTGKQKNYPKLVLTAIHAGEAKAPNGRERIDWKLLTDRPVRSCLDAIEKMEWYAQRWKIETFHKILKSGCHAEEAKLRAAVRLVNLIAILCILSWRIFWITMLNRTTPAASPDEAFTELDQYLLGELLPTKPGSYPISSIILTTSSSWHASAAASHAHTILRQATQSSGEASPD